jgi:hypothetical protein
LKSYCEALHDALEREIVEVPDNCKELRECCRELENRLKRCPNGDELIAVAKSNIPFYSKFRKVS